MCKCKCPFHFSKGIPKALSSIIVVNDLILIVDLTFQERLFLPKKFIYGMGVQWNVPKCLSY
jgi:hypothetical protein